MEDKYKESATFKTELNDREKKEIKRSKIKKQLEKRLKLKSTIWYICGILEILFAFRLVFKVMGANPNSTFILIIYNISGVFLAPFNGIFRSAVTSGVETESVLEPMILIAMAVYAIITYGIVRLIEIYDPKKIDR